MTQTDYDHELTTTVPHAFPEQLLEDIEAADDDDRVLIDLEEINLSSGTTFIGLAALNLLAVAGAVYHPTPTTLVAAGLGVLGLVVLVVGYTLERRNRPAACELEGGE